MSSIFRRRPRLAVGWTLAALAATSGPAWAEPAPSYDALLRRLGQTPAALEADALVDAAEARARQASARPNPALTFEAENLRGSGPASGLDAADLNLSVSQDLELWGRRPARIGVARAEAEGANLRRDMAMIETAARLALTYAEAEVAQRRADLAQDSLTLALADARAAVAMVEEGREPMLRAIQAESEAAAARAALDEASAERDAAFGRLNALTGAIMPEPPSPSSGATSISDSLLDITPAARSLDRDAPSVRVAEADQAAAERRVVVERINARPDVSASIGMTRSGLDDRSALTVGFSLPLPLFDRNRGNIDAARAEFRAAQARVSQARQDVLAERVAASARLRSSSSRVAAADAGISAADEAYRLSRIGAEAGRISQLELRVSRAALINARSAALDARLARVRAEIDLARLEGRAPFKGFE